MRNDLVSTDTLDAVVDLWARGEEEACINRILAMDKKRAAYVAARMAGCIMEDMGEVQHFLRMIERRKK